MIRKNFLLPPEDADHLERLRTMTRRNTDTAVILLALQVLWDLVTTLLAGHTIVFLHKDGTKKEYHPLLGQEKT